MQWDVLDSMAIKKHHKQLKSYLVWLDRLGALSRQEAVSMIPPLCLDVERWHKVLDLCAAPGSKTSQILDMMQWCASVLRANTTFHDFHVVSVSKLWFLDLV